MVVVFLPSTAHEAKVTQRKSVPQGAHSRHAHICLCAPSATASQVLQRKNQSKDMVGEAEGCIKCVSKLKFTYLCSFLEMKQKCSSIP